MCILQRNSRPLRLSSYTRPCYRGLPGNCLLVLPRPVLLECLTSPTTAIFHSPFASLVCKNIRLVCRDFSLVLDSVDLSSAVHNGFLADENSSVQHGFHPGLCLQKKRRIRGTADGVCPWYSLSSISPSALRYRADQKKNNGSKRREVKEWDSVNTETKIWWPCTPSHIHTVTDLMATFLPGNNGCKQDGPALS